MNVDKNTLNEINKYKEVGMSLSWISKKMNIPLGKIKYLKELDLLVKTESRTKKELFCDYHFFDKIDTEEKAYWLGFIYADGCITDKGCLSILLSTKDKSHLDMFKKHILAEHPIRDGVTKRKARLDMGMKEGIQYHSSINIHSKEMAKSLLKLGVWPRKSFNIKFPTFDQVPESLFNHFIRGYLDGNGYVCSKITNADHYHVSVGFISSLDFCKDLSIFLNKKLSLNNKEVTPHHRTKGIGSIVYGKQSDFFKIKDYLYNNASVFLERKKIKFYSINKKEFLFTWHKILKIALELKSEIFSYKDLMTEDLTLRCVRYFFKKALKLKLISYHSKNNNNLYYYKINKNQNYYEFIENYSN